MPNIRIDLGSSVINGQTLTFKSPADCSAVTGLIVYYPDGESTVSKTFQFADAHGNDVGSVSLFAENVLVKVILDTTLGRAYVQNADTNKYIEETFLNRKTGGVIQGQVSFENIIVLKRGENYGTEDEIPDNFPDGGFWLKVVE